MMNLPYVTALYAALLGLLAAALTIQVIVGRGRYVVAAGDGGNPMLAQAIRAHANFAEQVPMALLVIAFAEVSGTPKPFIHVLGIALVVARLFSAVGLSNSLADKLPRRIGAALTILTVIAASVLILLRMVGVV
jgi:uncharacterized membrane protein YecN with MAPEG domain